ncbi:MAG: fructokinase [Gammaproteobacteria bacterium]
MKTLKAKGVNTDSVLFCDEAQTGLAFVSLKADGDREFLFYRHPGADMLLRSEEIDA